MYKYTWIYEKIIAPTIASKFGLENIFSIPNLDQIEIVINTKVKGMSEEDLLTVLKELYVFSGQKPSLVLKNKFNIRKANYLIKINLRKNAGKIVLYNLITYILPGLIKKNQLKFFSTTNNSTLSFTIRDINLLKRDQFVNLQSKFNIVFLIKSNKKEKAYSFINKFFFKNLFIN